jgi:uncharacterized membrane protein
MNRTVRRIRLGAWMIPLTYCAGAMVAGVLSQRLANALFPELVSSISVSAAIGVYSAVASGMISLTGVVFALMFVVVQMSATVYSPRLVFWIARDRITSHAMGAFTATFLYSLTALTWVDRGGSGKVPLLSVLVATALLVFSICMFIALVERVGILQVNRMLIFIGSRGRSNVDRLFPPIDASPATVQAGTHALPPRTQTVLHRGDPMYVQTVDTAGLVRLGREHGCVVEVTAAVGDAVLEDTPLLAVRGGSSIPEHVLRSAVVLDSQRTFEQDPGYALRLLVDIAIRAL